MEAISGDFNDQLLRVLGSQRLMYMDYGKFENVMAMVADVFATWDDNMKDFTNVAREGGSAVFAKNGHLLTPPSFPEETGEIHLDQDQPRPRSTARTSHLSSSFPKIPRTAPGDDRVDQKLQWSWRRRSIRA